MGGVWNKNEDWECLKRFFPDNWKEKAKELGVWQRTPRNIHSIETLLRLFLIHFAEGCSLRETAVRAREGQLADISDVALLKRLRVSGEWLRWMTVKLLERQGISSSQPNWLEGLNVRVVDATVVCEPGNTGTDWRVHYSLKLFGLQSDELTLTGPKVGESFLRFKIAYGDLMMGDRAYGSVKGFRYVLSHGGHFVTRLRNKSFALIDHDGNEKSLGDLVSPLALNEEGDWSLLARVKGQKDLPIRICAIRFSEEAAAQAMREAKKTWSKKQRSLDPDTLALHRYVIIATSLPERITAPQILMLYRSRWQIEIAFKRMKSILGLGHLPKREDSSAKACLHGKLFVSILAQAIIEEGRRFSPWGYPLGNL